MTWAPILALGIMTAGFVIVMYEIHKNNRD
jgi:hypothetical protein